MAEFDNVRIADLAQYLLSTDNRPIRLVFDHAGGNKGASFWPRRSSGTKRYVAASSTEYCALPTVPRSPSRTSSACLRSCKSSPTGAGCAACAAS